MNYVAENSVLKSYFNGSRRLSNLFWAIAVSLGGFGFFLTGLSSFFKVNLLVLSDSSGIAFIPQGIVLLFYGTVGSILGIFLLLTILWNVGSGYNEYDKRSQSITLYRKGFPGKNRELLFNFDFDDINDMKDVGKKYAIDKIMDFVKNNKKIVPFRYQKSSWYIKGNNGWEKEIIQSNKNCKTGTSQYTFSIIVEKFIFIFANRFTRYCVDKYGDNYPYMCNGEYARIRAEVLSQEGYRNSDILKSIRHFC